MTTPCVSMKRSCASCPFRLDASGHFRPEVLDATVGKNLRDGFAAHHCHTTNNAEHPKVCAGFVAYVKRTGTHNTLLDFAEANGILAPVDTETAFIPGTWRDILRYHALREAVNHIPRALRRKLARRRSK